MSFIISRDGYLKAAMRDPDYAGLQSMVVREGDHFEIHPSEGRVVHRFGAKRGPSWEPGPSATTESARP